jgi:uncharacterized membrane protein
MPDNTTTTTDDTTDEERAMTAFTVWKFDDPTGAERAVKVLRDAASDGLVKIIDHAVVSWPETADRPRTEHGHDDPKRAAGWGALWGVLAGALFLVPVVGGVVGAGIGALSKATEGTGISKDDLTRIRTELTPGTSALFIVTEEGDLDRLAERFRFTDVKLIHTNLTDAERSVLLETFGGV